MDSLLRPLHLHELQQKVSVRGCGALLCTAGACKLFWDQYRVLLNKNLPAYSIEWPLLGSFPSMIWHGYEEWARRFLGTAQARLTTSFFGSNAVVITWDLYEKYVKKADNGGELHQGEFSDGEKKLLGEHSIILLRAGKGQHHHARLRSKVLHSLTPKRVLGQIPNMLVVFRDVLDRMVKETEDRGFARFEKLAMEIPRRVVMSPIIGNLDQALQIRMAELMEDLACGFIAVPINMGRFSAFGRALQAKSELNAIIKSIMSSPDQSDNVVKDLAHASEGGRGFIEEEIVDTIITLLFAGQITTSEALPHICVEIANRPEWAARIAEEKFELEQIEYSASPAVCFIREVLRHHPPESIFLRQTKTMPIDLGEHGHVPVGCNVAMNFGDALWSLGSDFNPDRWTEQLAHDKFLNFGGHSPHSCVGRSLAMVEMQVFMKVLCREYEIEAVDTTMRRDWSSEGLLFKYNDGCKLKVKKK